MFVQGHSRSFKAGMKRENFTQKYKETVCARGAQTLRVVTNFMRQNSNLRKKISRSKVKVKYQYNLATARGTVTHIPPSHINFYFQLFCGQTDTRTRARTHTHTQATPIKTIAWFARRASAQGNRCIMDSEQNNWPASVCFYA